MPILASLGRSKDPMDNVHNGGEAGFVSLQTDGHGQRASLKTLGPRSLWHLPHTEWLPARPSERGLMDRPTTLREIEEWLRALSSDVTVLTPEEVASDLEMLAAKLGELCDRLEGCTRKGSADV